MTHDERTPMMRLTRENAPQYEGKLLDSSRKLFHYYPLKVVNHPTFGYMYVDRYHVMMRIPENGIMFDSIIPDSKDEEVPHDPR